MLGPLLNTLSPARKRRLKSIYYKFKRRLIDLVYAYSYADLLKTLRSLGLHSGDILMVHSSFGPFNGFQGTPHDVIKALKEVLGPDEGTLLMVSLPYTGSAREYLKKIKWFDVNRTISRMGLISEIFRRQKDVVRSLHPTHPVLACGPLAAWFIEGHEQCIYPCGPGSPFEKLAQKNGKVLFFDVPFNTITFIHYLEHCIQDRLPFPLYGQEIFSVKVVDAEGTEKEVRTRAFSNEAVQKRRPGILEKELLATRRIKKQRIGRTSLGLVEVQDVISCVNEMTGKGLLFYET